MARLRDMDGRLKLPWKEDPKEARRIYMQVWRGCDVEEIKKKMKQK